MKKFALLLMLVFGAFSVVQAKTIQMRVATYNLRCATEYDDVRGNGWKQRWPHVSQLIRYHGFEIFGTQECVYAQSAALKEALPGYDFVGGGRNDGKKDGESASIFYNTQRFKLLDNGDFWFSETPDVPGSMGWDAACTRICSWGKFLDKKNRFEFLFINLHLDHIGVKARIESTKMVLALIRKQPKGMPIIVTGDFNVDQHNASYHNMNNSGIVRDAYELAEYRYAPNGTYNDYDINGYTESRIDHIFLSNHFMVKKYGILTDTYRVLKPEYKGDANCEAAKKDTNPYMARIPSDHYPVVIDVEIKK